MNKAMKLIAFVGSLWLLDLVVYDGRYSSAVWDQANYQGQMVQYSIQDWFKRVGL